MNQGWVTAYDGLSQDETLIPTMGVRVLLGIDGEGHEAISMTVDGESIDHIKAAFMLEIVLDMVKKMARAEFVGTVKQKGDVP